MSLKEEQANGCCKADDVVVVAALWRKTLFRVRILIIANDKVVFYPSTNWLL